MWPPKLSGSIAGGPGRLPVANQLENDQVELARNRQNSGPICMGFWPSLTCTIEPATRTTFFLPSKLNQPRHSEKRVRRIYVGGRVELDLFRAWFAPGYMSTPVASGGSRGGLSASPRYIGGFLGAPAAVAGVTESAVGVSSGGNRQLGPPSGRLYPRAGGWTEVTETAAGDLAARIASMSTARGVGAFICDLRGGFPGEQRFRGRLKASWVYPSAGIGVHVRCRSCWTFHLWSEGKTSGGPGGGPVND